MMNNSKKIRVLFVSHTYVVGVNQGKLDAMIATDQAEVALIAPAKWQAKGWSEEFELEQKYPLIHYYPASVLFSGVEGAYLYNPWDVFRAIQDFKPDVIQVEQEVFSISAFEMSIFCRLTKIPLVVFSWENQQRQLSFPRKWICKFVLNTALSIIAGNQDGKKVLETWNYRENIEVMPQMGVDTNLFFNKEIKQDNEYKELHIGYMGRFVECKGIDLLLSAAHELKKSGYKFKLTLCGSGIEEKPLKLKTKELEITDLTIWKEKVSHADVPLVMSKFDVFVLPSRTTKSWKEQFGHVLIEAMSMGIPTIASNCGEIPNVVNRKDLIFSENNIVELTAILEKMINNFQWYKEIKTYSIERVREHYSHQKIADKHINLWQKIIA